MASNHIILHRREQFHLRGTVVISGIPAGVVTEKNIDMLWYDNGVSEGLGITLVFTI